MSKHFRFKISVSQLYIHSAFVLLGILLASIFIYFSPTTLLGELTTRFLNYFEFGDYLSVLSLLFQEWFWILLILTFTYIPHGRILNIIILIYKGFSIGIIASILCWQKQMLGILYIIASLLPQNIIYIISLLLAVQVSFEIQNNIHARSSRHGREIATDKKAYIISFVLTLFAVLLETYLIPYVFHFLK